MITELMMNPSIATVLVVGLWGLIAAGMFIKQEWFFNFDMRKPKIRAFDLQIFTDSGRFIFMACRIVAIWIIAYVLGMFIILIFS